MHASSAYRRRLLIGAICSAVACLLLAATSAAAAAPPAGPALTPPVASDCSVDVTAAFNTWLGTVPDGSVIALKPAGCYRSNGSIKFTDRHNITIEGNDATIKASGLVPCRPGGTMNAAGYCIVPGDPKHCPAGTATGQHNPNSCAQLYNRAQLWFDRGSNMTVRNLTLQGTNFSADCAPTVDTLCYDSLREADGNAFVFGTNGALFDHVNFKNARGDAVELTPGGTWDHVTGNGAVITQNVTVQNSTVNTTGRHAFTCTDCSNFVVRNNKIINVGYWVTDVEVEAPTWHGEVTLAGNTYSNVYLGLLAVTPNVKPSTLGPIIVRNNIATDLPPTCQYSLSINRGGGRQPSSVTVTGNTFRSRDGIFINAAHADVDNNTLNLMPQPCLNGPTDPGLPGIEFSNVTGGSITGNTVIGATPFYKLSSSTGVKVCSNRTTATGPFNQPAVC